MPNLAALTLSPSRCAASWLETATFGAQLRALGLPEVMVARITGFLTDVRNGREDEVSPDLERLLGRRPAPLEEGLRTLYKL